ncbi:PREDICTED: uncharacterized protein LOC104586723 [Nelumbo nucifera]|uniref:Uncharacterized protein LOC104586723 n=1 Tax=Nelumbo nucifera TaxID=4432 RepID=A0A1U7YQI4_NELNU|nr:PREDICTED: uncharacterized protein LOC104586723 [Nelumbo nucifera]
MGMQLRCGWSYRDHNRLMVMVSSSSPQLPVPFSSFQFCSPPSIIFPSASGKHKGKVASAAIALARKKRGSGLIVASSSSDAAAVWWDGWTPDKGAPSPSLSDVFWPSAGAFAAMALLGKIDQLLAPRGISMTIAPFGAVCAVLFASPSAPAARKYNMFMAQIGCAAIGVVSFTILGPGWLARSAALAASLAFMIYTRSTHPPAASLPILFIDGAKLHQLHIWYALFPGAIGCMLLCLIQEMVSYMKANFRF